MRRRSWPYIVSASVRGAAVRPLALASAAVVHLPPFEGLDEDQLPFPLHDRLRPDVPEPVLDDEVAAEIRKALLVNGRYASQLFRPCLSLIREGL